MPASTCLNCGISEQERPLLQLKFQGREQYICPQCLPILIHKPYEFAEKLPNGSASEYPGSDKP
jgi:hypothetical protein